MVAAGADTKLSRYTLLQALLWLLITASTGCFVIITFMRPTDWYSQDLEFGYIRNNMTIVFPGDVPVPTTTAVKKDKTVTVLIGKDVPLWAGSSAFPVTLQWGSVMIAALATAGLQQLAKMQSSGQPGSPDTPRFATGSAAAAFMYGVCGALATLKRKVHRVFSTQVAPVRFWSWWCGGLSVLDAFLVLVWCGLTVCYLYSNISRKFKSTAASLTPPPAADSTGPSPTGSAPGVDLLSPLFMAKRLENCGKSTGETLRGLVMVMFLPISRSNFLKWICGTDYPTLIKYHRWMSWGTIMIATFHGLLYMIQWGAEGTLDHELSWSEQATQRNVMGLIAGIAGLVIAFTSTTWFRANYYWLFYKTHIVGMLVFTSFAMMHYKNLANWILPGLVLYAIDRAFRYWQLATNWTSLGPEDVSIDGSMMTVQLTWAKREDLTITAGQEVYLRCPSISLFGSHPFSIADVRQSDDGTTHAILHFVARGPWTTALKNKIQQGRRVWMQVEGPYSTTLDHIPTTPVVVMVAGGIGVTPVLALLRQYMRQYSAFLARDSDDGTDTTAAAAVPKVYFVWSARRLSELKLFGQSLLSACTSTSPRISPANSLKHEAGDYVPPAVGADSATKPHTLSLTKRASAESGSDHQISGVGKGWLQAALHYTGFELENKQNSVEVNVSPSTMGDRAAVTDAAPPRQLAAHPASTPYIYALCVLLGFFGAWAGMLAAAYYDGYWTRTTAAGPDYLSVGIVQWLLIAAGGIFTPMAVLAMLKAVSRCMQARGSAPSLFAETPGLPARSPTASRGDLLGSFLHNTLMVLPGYILAPCKSGGESDGMALSRGRPDLKLVLNEVVQAHSEVTEIEVLVAGGDALVESVMLLCAEHNCSRSKGPALLVKRVAHHH